MANKKKSNDKEYQQHIDTYIKEFTQKAMDLYGLDISHTGVKLDLKGKVAAWTRYNNSPDYKTWYIQLNVPLLMEQPLSELRDTIGHEIAHIVAGTQYVKLLRDGKIKEAGEWPTHCKKWKKIMVDFGLPPVRCHNYDTTNHKRKRKPVKRPWIYSCACRSLGLDELEQHELTNYMHKKIKKGAEYICTKCKEHLTFVKEKEL